MDIKIRNYKKIKEADLYLNKLLMLQGQHGNGKTSIINACQSILTGLPNPFKNVLKKHASMFVHSGTPQGEVELIHNTGSAKINFPEMVCLQPFPSIDRGVS